MPLKPPMTQEYSKYTRACDQQCSVYATKSQAACDSAYFVQQAALPQKRHRTSSSGSQTFKTTRSRHSSPETEREGGETEEREFPFDAQYPGLVEMLRRQRVILLARPHAGIPTVQPTTDVPKGKSCSFLSILTLCRMCHTPHECASGQ
jgi:hypothetical protein